MLSLSHASRVLGIFAATCLTTALCACTPAWQQIQTGQDVSAVVARLGPPKETYRLSDGGRRLLWPTQPMGETTVAATVDAAGKVRDIRQVLTNEEFARAQIGKWTQHDVLQHFGKPERTAYFPLMKRSAWTYRYMDSDVWYMLYSFYFDPDGVLALTQKTPDPLHDPGRRGLF